MMAINAGLMDIKPVADKSQDSANGFRASEQGGTDLIERFSQYKQFAMEADKVKISGGNESEYEKLEEAKKGNMGEKWLARL